MAKGHTARGTIKIHCHKRQRYRCTLCGKTFSARQGTPFHYSHTPVEIMTCVLTLIAYGCPVAAIEAAFGFDRRTVRAWIEKAGRHAQAVHAHLVLQPQILQHVEVDEIFVRTQQRFVYLFSALCVSTRRWLGGFITRKRDQAAALRLPRSCTERPSRVRCWSYRTDLAPTEKPSAGSSAGPGAAAGLRALAWWRGRTWCWCRP